MTKESLDGLSRGGARERRQVLATERDKPGYPRIVEGKRQQARARLEDIGGLLRGDELTPLDRAKLQAEEIWIKFALDPIDSTSQREREKEMGEFLRNLQAENPDIYNQLLGIGGDNNKPTPLAEIRNLVLGSIRTVGGYYTKRP